MQLPDGARPTGLEQDGADTLLVSWSHGHEGRHGVRDLRLACKCAECVDEWSGEKRLDEASIPADVHPDTIEPVGLYGLQIQWSDGHNTGIYTWETLAELCQCAACETPVPDKG
jgi:DUF971 family protein